MVPVLPRVVRCHDVLGPADLADQEGDLDSLLSSPTPESTLPFFPDARVLGTTPTRTDPTRTLVGTTSVIFSDHRRVVKW